MVFERQAKDSPQTEGGYDEHSTFEAVISTNANTAATCVAEPESLQERSPVC
jgi:hypothetical protein